jgi:hypothetical protein
VNFGAERIGGRHGRSVWEVSGFYKIAGRWPFPRVMGEILSVTSNLHLLKGIFDRREHNKRAIRRFFPEGNK